MGFELRIVSNTPLTGEQDKEKVARMLLEQIGYLSGEREHENAFKLFTECFMEHPNKSWIIDDLITVLGASKPTVYRHLNKLKGLDLLEELNVVDEKTGQVKKGYKIRYGNLSKAWNFVEAHAKVALENYRVTVDHLQKLSETKK